MAGQIATVRQVHFPFFDENEFVDEQIDGDGSAVIIRALNPDNRFDNELLVELLSKYFSSGYPADGVFDTEFLTARIRELDESENLVNIVAEQDGKFVAHIALRYCGLSGCVEILLPAIDPDARKELFRFSRQMWERIESLAARQQWKMAFQFSSAAESALQVISAKCFDSYAMGIIPSSESTKLSGEGVFQRQSGLLLMVHIFAPGEESPVKLFPPSRHFLQIRELYSDLPLVRTFHSHRASGSRTSQPQAAGNGVPHEEVFVDFDERLDLHFLRIHPSTLQHEEEVREFIARFVRRSAVEHFRVCAAIALDDPACPDFCETLEKEMGMRFCGVLPLLTGHDYVLYSRFDPASLSELTLYTPRARALQDYVARQT